MGFLDFFGRKNSAGALAKHAKRAADKRAQNPDRWASILALGEIKTPESAAALLQRFTIRIDPSITDQEEKNLAMNGILAVGEGAVEPIRSFLKAGHSIAWPIKMLEKIVDTDALVTILLELLEGMHTDYERDPSRKVDLIAQLEERRDPRIADAVARFLEDVNETVRFHAAATLLAQEDCDAHREACMKLLAEDESVRVRVSVLDGFIARGWGLGPTSGELQSRLPPGYKANEERVERIR
ncbi:MAG: HEAT repeat domain-containing protein [Myxococcota bacterium]